MDSGLKVRQLIFGEQGLTFVVQRAQDGEYFHAPVAKLFGDEQLLAGFSLADIRLISYFAVGEEYESDRIFLKKLSEK